MSEDDLVLTSYTTSLPLKAACSARTGQYAPAMQKLLRLCEVIIANCNGASVYSHTSRAEPDLP